MNYRRESTYSTFENFDKSNRASASNFHYVQSQQQSQQQMIGQPKIQPRGNKQPEFSQYQQPRPQPPRRPKVSKRPKVSNSQPNSNSQPFSIPVSDIGINIFYPPEQQISQGNGGNNWSRSAVRM